MEKIILFDTSVASPNKGDEIIMQSCKEQLGTILKGNFIFNLPTHTPISHWYQNFSKFNVGDYYRDIKYKFVCGTNILNSNVCLPTPLWNVNVFNSKIAKGTILLGVGLGSKSIKPNYYTKMFYKKVLSSEFVHSTRDERSANFLRSMGFKAINTGCATTWNLTNEFCRNIPKTKNEKVVFTLTDYKKDVEKDKIFIETLLRNYEEIFFWIQGAGDFDYLKNLGYMDKVKLVSPELLEYEKVLDQKVDYVGTRLHAGIKAMQKSCRAIILSVDNRAEDMKKDFQLPIVSRNDIELLDGMINSSLVIEPNIKTENIHQWLQQFR